MRKYFWKISNQKIFAKVFEILRKKKQHRSPNKSSKSEIGANFYNSLSIFANFRKILYFLFFIYSILYNNFFLFVKKIFKHLFFIFISQKLLKTFETFRNNKIFVYLFINKSIIKDQYNYKSIIIVIIWNDIWRLADF